MSWGIENQKKRKDILDLMDIGVRKTTANHNYVNEVAKSTNGCWMDQIYGLQRCDICDLTANCPVREEMEWQAYLKENNIVVEKKS
jgi:hypothetical protein